MAFTECQNFLHAKADAALLLVDGSINGFEAGFQVTGDLCRFSSMPVLPQAVLTAWGFALGGLLG